MVSWLFVRGDMEDGRNYFSLNIWSWEVAYVPVDCTTPMHIYTIQFRSVRCVCVCVCVCVKDDEGFSRMMKGEYRG